MDCFTELLIYLIAAGLMILCLCSSAYFSGKSQVFLDTKQTIVVVRLIEALREVCPVGSSKGWTLLPSNGGIPRCWNTSFQFPTLLQNTTIYGSSIIIRSLPQVIMSIIADTSKWVEWEPSSSLHSLYVKQFEDPFLREDNYMQCDKVIRKENEADSDADPLMYRFKHWYSNNVGWILFWHNKHLLWWFFLVQPTEENSENSQCLLTFIQGINPQLIISKDLIMTLVQKLRNIKDAAEMSSLKILPFNSLSVPEGQSKELQSSYMPANKNCNFFEQEVFCQTPSSSDSDVSPNAVLKLVPFSNKTYTSLQNIKGFIVVLQEIQSPQIPENFDSMMQNSSSRLKAFLPDSCESIYSQSEVFISTNLNQTKLSLSKQEKMCHKQVTDQKKNEMLQSERMFSSYSINEEPLSNYYKTEIKNSDDSVPYHKKSVDRPQENGFTQKQADYQRKELADAQVSKLQKESLGYVDKKNESLLKEHYPQKIVTNSNRSNSPELLKKQSNRRRTFISSFVQIENGLNSDVKMRSVSTPLNLSNLPNMFSEETVLDNELFNCGVKQWEDDSALNKHSMPLHPNKKTYKSTGDILNGLDVDNNSDVDVECHSPEITDFEILLPKLQISEGKLAELRTKGNCSVSELHAAVLNVSSMNKFASSDDQKLSSDGWLYLSSFKGISLMTKRGSFGSLKTVSYLSQIDIPVKIDEAWNIICNPRSRFIYDETVKKVKILEEFSDGQKILHVYHELNSILKKEAMDFCLLHTERQEDSKYCVALKSIEYENCPLMNCVSRGTLLSSGWVIEEAHSDYGQCKITHIIQVIVGSPNSMLIDELNCIHPQTLHNLKTYLITRPL